MPDDPAKGCSAQVKPVSEFLQTHGPGKLRHRPNPLLPSLSQTLPTSFTPLRDRERRPPCTVKKISGHQHTIPIDRGLWATDVHRLVIQRQEFGISRHVASNAVQNLERCAACGLAAPAGERRNLVLQAWRKKPKHWRTITSPAIRFFSKR